MRNFERGVKILPYGETSVKVVSFSHEFPLRSALDIARGQQRRNSKNPHSSPGYLNVIFYGDSTTCGGFLTSKVFISSNVAYWALSR